MIGANELTGDTGLEEAGQLQARIRYTSLWRVPVEQRPLVPLWEFVCV